MLSINSSSKRPNKEINFKENKSNTALEHVLNTYTDFAIEDYLIHSKIFLEYDNIEAYIIILKESILFSYVLEEEIKKIKTNPIITKIQFSQIYNFDLIVNQGFINSIILLYFENKINNKIQSKISFNFSKDSYLIHHFLKKNYILTWQRNFEEKILKDNLNEIYQYHFYVKKINNRGKFQDRILMFSNKVFILKINIFTDQQFIYNIKSKFKENTFKLKQEKWSDAIKAIIKLNIFVDKEFQLRIYFDKNINKEENFKEKKKEIIINMKEIRDFIFISESDFNYFLFLIKRLYYNISNNFIVIELVKFDNYS